MKTLQHLINLPDGYRLIPFSPAHFYLYDYSEMERATFAAFPGYLDWLTAQSQIGPSATAMRGGECVMSFGLVPMIPGVAEFWMLRGSTLRHHGRPFLRSARQFFNVLGTALDLRRVQFTVHAQNVDGVRFAQWLNFEIEGRSRALLPDGSDSFSMARIYKKDGKHRPQTF